MLERAIVAPLLHTLCLAQSLCEIILKVPMRDGKVVEPLHGRVQGRRDAEQDVETPVFASPPLHLQELRHHLNFEMVDVHHLLFAMRASKRKLHEVIIILGGYNWGYMDKTARAELEGIIKFGNAMMQACDPNSDGHDNRVALLASSLAIRLQHPREFIEVIVCAARVHDIGKIAIPKAVLANGKLNDAEMAMIREHSVIGADTLQEAGVDAAVVSIVRHHHCNYDGTGYPDGLHGEMIPLGARILRVVDTYDALTNLRTYREKLNPMQALDEMDGERGFYDPHIFNMFTRMLAERR